MMNRRLLILGTTALILTGCTAIGPAPDFACSGRFSAVTRDTGGSPSAVNGRFSLTEYPGHTQLDLLTPLNGILARIEVTPAGAILSRGLQDERPVTDASAEALLSKQLGFSVPVKALRNWFESQDNTFRADSWTGMVLRRSATGTPQTVRARCSSPDITLTLILDDPR